MAEDNSQRLKEMKKELKEMESETKIPVKTPEVKNDSTIKPQMATTSKPSIPRGPAKDDEVLKTAKSPSIVTSEIEEEAMEHKYRGKANRKIKLLVFVLLFFIILLGGATYYQKVKNAKKPVQFGFPTPTVSQYQRFRPSVYADDKEVLKLEEDVNVLQKELSVGLESEAILLPPALDFKVSF